MVTMYLYDTVSTCPIFLDLIVRNTIILLRNLESKIAEKTAKLNLGFSDTVLHIGVS